MAHCHDMTVGEIYVCESCGMELQVLKGCDEGSACSCAEDLQCCGKPLTLKT
jgi:hypothetical protein